MLKKLLIRKNSISFVPAKREELLAFIVYSVTTLALVFYHEPWFDELQAWLISRELNFWGILYQMRYEGHFALWSLLLHPFAALGFPVITMNLISWLLSLGAAWLLLFKSPFHKIVKYGLLLSAAFIYWFPVVARCYALIPPILFLIAYFYPKQNQRPLLYAFFIGLLAHTHSYMEGTVGILFIYYVWDNILKNWKKLNLKERKIRIMGAAIIVCMVLLAFLQVAPSFGYSHLAKVHVYKNFKDLIFQFYESIHYGLIYPYIFLPFMQNTLFGKVFIIILILFILVILRYSPRQFLILIVGFGWQLAFALFIFGMGHQRTFLFFYLLIFACWLLLNEPFNKGNSGRVLSLFLVLFSILTYGNTFNFVIRDINQDFSSEKKIGDFLHKNIPQGEIIFFDSHRNISVNAYAPEYTYRYLHTLDSVEFETYSKYSYKKKDFFGNLSKNAFNLSGKEYYYAVFDYPLDTNEIKKRTNNNISFSLLLQSSGFYYYSDRYVFKIKQNDHADSR